MYIYIAGNIGLGEINSVKFINNSLCVSLGFGGISKLWDLRVSAQRNNPIYEIRSPSNGITASGTCLAVCEYDQNYIATGIDEGLVSVWVCTSV